ncbi:uncharacterized protein [Procambarus clarkii]|uniref:uncharacterized protein n=1 Tax=Procambarus clarkii TaxID=6728 RepID=UPI0037448D06
MFKWFQNRLQKGSGHSVVECGNKYDAIIHDCDEVEMAAEAVQGEVEASINDDSKEDDTHLLEVNPAQIDQAQVTQTQTFSCDSHQDPKFDNLCSIKKTELCEILQEVNGQMQINPLEQKLQDNGILSATKENHNISRIEIEEIISESLNQNIFAVDRELQVKETPIISENVNQNIFAVDKELQVKETPIISENLNKNFFMVEKELQAKETSIISEKLKQNSTLVNKELLARETLPQLPEHSTGPKVQCNESFSKAQENVAISSGMQSFVNLEQGCLGTNDDSQDLERFHCNIKAWKSNDNLTNTLEDVPVKSYLQFDNDSNYLSVGLSGNFETGSDTDINGVNKNAESLFISSQTLESEGSNTNLLYNDTIFDSDNENCFEDKAESFNQYSPSVSLKCTSSETEELSDVLKLEEINGHENVASAAVSPPNTNACERQPVSVSRLNVSSSLASGKDPCVDPYPRACLQLSCLYNHHGKLCTVLDDHFILTYVKEAPVLVSFRIASSDTTPVGCVFLWKTGKPFLLERLPDGTEVCFDAVVMPNDTKFTALVIWQGAKPALSIEPYFNSYVFVEELQDLEVNLISFRKENGLVSTVIDGEIQLASFSKSVVFINGKKVENIDDIMQFSRCNSQQLFANVCKLASVDFAGKIIFGFMCSCLWSGKKITKLNLSAVLNPFMLYRKGCGFYVQGKRQINLYCDADVELTVNNKDYNIVYKSEVGDISIVCHRNRMFCGNRRVVPTSSGKVKAHIRRVIRKTGKLVWEAVMVQIPDTLLSEVEEASITNVNNCKEAAKEMSSITVSEEKCLPFPSKGNDKSGAEVEEIMELYDTGRKPKPLASCSNENNTDDIIKLNISETTSCTIEDNVTNDKQYVSSVGSNLHMVEIHNKNSERTLVKSEVNATNSALDSNCNTASYAEILKKRTSENISNKYNEKGKYTHKAVPKVLKNCSGKMRWLADSEAFKIDTVLNGNPYVVHVGSAAWMVENGICVPVEKRTSSLPVSFDIYFDDSLRHGHRIAALWVGEKPNRGVNKNGIFYFDILGIYLGLHEGDMKFRVCIDNVSIYIKACSTNRVYSAEGEYLQSVPSNSSVVVHLRKLNDNASGRVIWKTLLIIVQPHKQQAVQKPLSDNIEDLSEKSIFVNSDSSKQISLKPNCRTSLVDLPQYIKNFPGILMLNEVDKIALFSCIGGTALWTSLPKNGFVCVDGKVAEIADIPLGTGLTFDAFCDSPSIGKYTAVIVWTGKRPHEAKYADGTKYFYDVKGLYCGISNGKFVIQLQLDGKLQNITFQKTGRVIMPDGSVNSNSLTCGDKIHAHLKYRVKLGVWQVILMFMFIDEDPFRDLEGHNKVKISATESCASNDTSISQSFSRSGNDDFLKPMENTENVSQGTMQQVLLSEEPGIYGELPCYSQTETDIAVTEDSTLYLNDCSGTLVFIDINKRAIKILFKEPLTILLSAYQLIYQENGRALSVLDVPVGSTVKFDALRSSKEIGFKPLMIWVEKRPCTLADDCGNTYFYDVKGIYLDTQNGYYKLILEFDSKIKHLLVNETRHVYFRNGRTALHALKTMVKIVVHLKKGNVEEEFGTKWKAIVIFVIPESNESIFTRLCDAALNTPLANLENEQSVLTESFDVNSKYANLNLQQSPTENINSNMTEHTPSLVCFSVFGGKVETVVGTEFKFTTKSRIENTSNQLNVHAVVEDIAPFVVEGVSVPRRILLLTSNMGLSLASQKFLVHSQIENEVNELKLDDNLGTEIDHLEKPEPSSTSKKHVFELKQASPLTIQDEIGDETFVDESKDVHNLSRTGSYTRSGSEYLNLLSSSKFVLKNTLSQSLVEGRPVDKNVLCGETLKRLIAIKSLEASTEQSRMKPKYLTLKGNIVHGFQNGSFVFQCEEEYRSIYLSSEIPHLNHRDTQNHSEKSYLFVHKMTDKKTKELIYNPLFIWHEGYKCNPYILINQKIILFNPQNNLLVLGNVQNNSLQYCIVEPDCAFTTKFKKSINDFCKFVEDELLSIYVVVEDISPVSVADYLVNKKILLISSCLSLALSSINTFTCNKSKNYLVTKDMICKIRELFQIYEERCSSARVCKGGSNYHMCDSSFYTAYGIKGVGGCLQFCIEEYAFILCDKKKTIAVCHISNTYYQGRNVSSWDEIDKKFWKNFFIITSSLEKEIKIQDESVGALGLVAWSCCGPEIVTVHVCHIHEPVVYVYKGLASMNDEETQVTHPLDNKPLGESCVYPLPSKEYSEKINANELEALDCVSGSNIFSVHEQILQSCGLRKTIGELKYFEEYLAVCASEMGEMIWCHLSNFFIKGEKCNSIEELMKLKKHKWCLIIIHCPATVLQGKTVNFKAVIGYIGSEVMLPGIHICNNHKGILLRTINKEDLAIAKEIFSDIQVICKQSDAYAKHLLEILYSRGIEEIFLSAKNVKSQRYIQFQGILVSVSDTDPNKAMVSIQYEEKEYCVSLQRHAFVSLAKDTLLQAFVGCPIKVILGYSENLKNVRVMMAWSDLNHASVLSPEPVAKITACTSSMNTELICCPRALVIQHFQMVYQQTFDILTGYQISTDLENSKVFFKCSQNAKDFEVMCRIDSVRTPPSDMLDNDDSPWCILVHFHYKKNVRVHIDGVAAWKGNVENVIIQVCDIHKVQLLDLIMFKKSTPAWKPIPARVKSDSESLYAEPPLVREPIPARVKSNSESLYSEPDLVWEQIPARVKSNSESRYSEPPLVREPIPARVKSDSESLYAEPPLVREPIPARVKSDSESLYAEPPLVREPIPARVKSNSESLYSEPWTLVSSCVKSRILSKSETFINEEEVEAAASTLEDHIHFGSVPSHLECSSVLGSDSFERHVGNSFINNLISEKPLAKSENRQIMTSSSSSSSFYSSSSSSYSSSSSSVKASAKSFEDATDPHSLTESPVLKRTCFEEKVQQCSTSETADEAHLALPDVLVSKAPEVVNNESFEGSASGRKNERDSDLFLDGCSVSCVGPCKFECADEYQGIIKSSDLTIIVIRQNICINKLPLNEPLTEFIRKENSEVQAMVVPLSTPMNVLGYSVTHEAIVAWVGNKPKPVSKLWKLYNNLHGISCIAKERKEQGANLRAEQTPDQVRVSSKEVDTLLVIDDKPQTLFGCIYVDSCSTHGTLRSGTGYILFAKEVIYRQKVRMSQERDIKTALDLKSVNAVILRLKEPVHVLGCQVTNIALLVWLNQIPDKVQRIINDSLDIYRKKWKVKLYTAQNAKVSGSSKLAPVENFKITNAASKLTHVNNNAYKGVSAKSGKNAKIKGAPVQLTPVQLAREDKAREKPILQDIRMDPFMEAQPWSMKNINLTEESLNGGDLNASVDTVDVFYKIPSRIECSNCKILLVGNNYAVIQSWQRTAVVRKDDFYRHNTKLPSSYPLCDQLKNVHSVCAFLTKMEKPVCLKKYTVTDFALLAFAGKCPKVAHMILSGMQNHAKKMMGLSVTTKFPPIPPENLSAVKTNVNLVPPKVKRSLESKSAFVGKLSRFSGFLEVTSETSEAVNIFFQRDKVYINKKPIPEDSSLADFMAPFINQPWNCSARLFPSKKNKIGTRRICGIEAHYLANFIWYGEKPSKEERESKLLEQSIKEPALKQKGKSTDTHSSSSNTFGKKEVLSCSQESGTAECHSTTQEVNKSESVADRLKKHIQNSPEVEINPSGGAKRKIKKTLAPWIDEKKNTPKGCISELHRLVGRLRLETGDHVYFSREKCFLYGVCLNKVELWHVLSIGIVVDYELSDDMKDVKGVWAGSTSSFEPSRLISKLQDWCNAYSVPDGAADLLLKEAGWLPPELNPTFDQDEEIEVVNCQTSS